MNEAETTGNLYGSVIDQEETGLPGATVTLTGNDDPAQVTVTDAEGQFRFLGLQPGSCRLTAELGSFSTVTYDNISIAAGRDTQTKFTLHATA